MKDLELLEMAAKAAGENGRAVKRYVGVDVVEVIERADGSLWMPYLDDGDALRLAVRLSLVINNRHRKALVEDMEGKQFWEDHEGDELAATRRAIVRAAAAIGSAM